MSEEKRKAFDFKSNAFCDLDFFWHFLHFLCCETLFGNGDGLFREAVEEPVLRSDADHIADLEEEIRIEAIGGKRVLMIRKGAAVAMPLLFDLEILL